MQLVESHRSLAEIQVDLDKAKVANDRAGGRDGGLQGIYWGYQLEAIRKVMLS